MPTSTDGRRAAAWVVVGADAADLDSFCCVEVLRQHYLGLGFQAWGLLPIPAAELEWRLDVQALRSYLGTAGWQVGLCGQDDFPWPLLEQAMTALHLVDRHDLPPAWRRRWPALADQVRVVSDHRPDRGELAAVPCRRVDPSLASCATLVYEQYHPASVSARILLAAAILQDTELLQSARTNQRDRAAAAALCAGLSRRQRDWLHTLPTYRQRSADQPASQQLGQDLKWSRFERIPVAVVQSSARQFWSRDDAAAAAAKLAATSSGLLLILHKPPRPARRQLSLVSSTTPPRWLSCLLAWPTAGWRPLQLECAPAVWELGNHDLTRKEILFKMETLMEEER